MQYTPGNGSSCGNGSSSVQMAEQVPTVEQFKTSLGDPIGHFADQF